MNAALLRRAYLLASSEASAVNRRLSDLRMEQKTLEERLKNALEIKNELASAVCRACLGHGCIQVWHDQDDVKAETCAACHGSGLSAGAAPAAERETK